MSASRGSLEEELGGTPVTPPALERAIAKKNALRRKMADVLALQTNGTLSGTTVFSLLTDAAAGDAHGISERIDGLTAVPGWGAGAKTGKRIVVSANVLDRPDLVEMIEGAGGSVVALDSCTGVRHWEGLVAEGSPDPLQAIARRYLTRPPCSRMEGIGERIDWLVKLAQTSRADGVVLTSVKYCDSWLYDQPLLTEQPSGRGDRGALSRKRLRMVGGGPDEDARRGIPGNPAPRRKEMLKMMLTEMKRQASRALAETGDARALWFAKWADLFLGAYEGDRPVVYTSFYAFPMEILHSCDIAPFDFELGASMLLTLENGVDLIVEAEDRGYSPDICSFHRASMASYYRDYFPKPDLLLTTSFYCAGKARTSEILSHLFAAPGCLLSVPQEITTESVRYVAAQLREIAGKVAALTGNAV